MAVSTENAPQMDVTRPDPGFGVYVHWPFCLSKCPYCDFNSHVRDSIDHTRWRSALLAELDHYAALTPDREVTSVFFGGGTPSLMAPETVAAVIERVGRNWRLANDAEVTLEANPTSAEAGKFASFAAAGVGRLSLGVQSLDDAALKFLGRQHSAAEALQAVALARQHFPRFSFDLIYARPEQSLDAWQAELTQALSEGADHLSLYQLTIEENTVFHGAWRRGELKVPEDERAGALFDRTQLVMEEAGLPAYEVSNHARPGQESRHNLTYWRYGDYIGVGPGAHGRLTLNGRDSSSSRKLATRQHRAPEAWLSAVEIDGHATRGGTEIDAAQRLEELVMMGLRLREGISRGAFSCEIGRQPEQLFDPKRLQALVESGFIEVTDRKLVATHQGRTRLDAVLAHLLA
ncbi:radical SAM family heme chaperone HemW [Pelagibius sp. Alg239-R121]|uniref:radical SAM family heme chaperone HemW n=1 Tax=Pelagibius sp. Alg239-R121 TaxID=2993448 RepID=UPI0024A6D764|nr:radical SAM family heme chaperone HemW [Pelagibius sp. Alg239-R121]